ncbi:ALDH-like protein [Dothidotthia symphoricarpi CBS 119687]|uniref:ALDH-like protein n=1 Tax=Dothidotthia symphoricarpi CBS 119687 TaxID=1392245 RepID=A0A6A6AM95_9PLEO|nr:ALDH-like protein [Dothidotthia symphoricarpi CBS 119687]KAF2132054.1 ALDH-like protein [Dothidotthia symphoricarpi CBS 119687]
MPSTSDNALASLQATAFTARCHNAYFRQKQLKSLHDVLRNDSSVIKDAISQDSHVSEGEAATEVAVALDVVREHYDSVDAKKELAEEYRVTNGKDASDRREPLGVVYIEPLRTHTPFFSTVVAVSAALAAGNCVALKVENNTRTLPSLLRTLLSKALEADTFAVVSSDPSTESLATCLQVRQETHISQPNYTQLASPKSRVIAVVDRTADLAVAAEHLVTARFSFGGTSPYAPDLVLVNEFVKKEFLEHVMRQSIRFLAGPNGSANTSTTKAQKPGSRTAEAFQALSSSEDWNLSVVTQGDNGAIVELSDLTALPLKSSQPIFSISATTSLEHAISLIDEDTEPQDTLLAAYFFGTPSAGKYLSQFIKADVSFANHIPYRLLLGPAAPSTQAIDIEKRYTTHHFTRASPAFITPPSSQTTISAAVASKDSRKASADLLAKATQEIKEKKRAEWIAIGYFEQGILLGLGLVGIPLLAAFGTSLYHGVGYGVSYGLRRWRK